MEIASGINGASGFSRVSIKEERKGHSNIDRYRIIINSMLLCVMHGNNETIYDTVLVYDTMHYGCNIIH